MKNSTTSTTIIIILILILKKEVDIGVSRRVSVYTNTEWKNTRLSMIKEVRLQMVSWTCIHNVCDTRDYLFILFILSFFCYVSHTS